MMQYSPKYRNITVIIIVESSLISKNHGSRCFTLRFQASIVCDWAIITNELYSQHHDKRSITFALYFVYADS